MESIFSESFLLEGNDKDSLLNALKMIENYSKHISLSFSNIDIGHILVKNKNIYVINMKHYGESFLGKASPAKENLLDKRKIEKEVLQLIFSNKIRTCLLVKQGLKYVPIFINDEARKYIVLRLGAKGSVFYEENIISDLALQKCLEHYIEKDFDTFNILKDKDTMVLTSVITKSNISNSFSPIKKIKEIEDKNLVLIKYKVSNTQIMAEFQPTGYEDEEEEFIPRIRVILTDTGYYKKLLCITTKESTRSCILKELSENTTVYEVLDIFDNICCNLVNEKEKIHSPYSLIKNNKKIKMVGDKRIASIKEVYSAKDFTKKSFLKSVLLLPDRFGYINPATDTYLESGIGELFTKGA